MLPNARSSLPSATPRRPRRRIAAFSCMVIRVAGRFEGDRGAYPGRDTDGSTKWCIVVVDSLPVAAVIARRERRLVQIFVGLIERVWLQDEWKVPGNGGFSAQLGGC